MDAAREMDTQPRQQRRDEQEIETEVDSSAPEAADAAAADAEAEAAAAAAAAGAAERIECTVDALSAYDGFKWHKYGQMNIKGRPNPRSYYKCMHEGCTARKYVEVAADDPGKLLVTNVGCHNHDMPPLVGVAGRGVPTSAAERIVDAWSAYDGFKWRKYTQKNIKDRPNPRSYYKCAHEGCTAHKHVEVAADDPGKLLVTNVGCHNHDMPPLVGAPGFITELVGGRGGGGSSVAAGGGGRGGVVGGSSVQPTAPSQPPEPALKQHHIGSGVHNALLQAARAAGGVAAAYGGGGGGGSSSIPAPAVSDAPLTNSEARAANAQRLLDLIAGMGLGAAAADGDQATAAAAPPAPAAASAPTPSENAANAQRLLDLIARMGLGAAGGGDDQAPAAAPPPPAARRSAHRQAVAVLVEELRDVARVVPDWGCASPEAVPDIVAPPPGYEVLGAASFGAMRPGCALMLLWPDDGAWYRGHVSALDTTSGAAVVTYDVDASVEKLNLRDAIAAGHVAWQPPHD